MMLTTNELPAHLRRRVLAIIVQAPWRSDQPECPHGCGVCDAPLRFVETDEHGHHWYNCAACPNGHTSQDCCCTIHAKNEDGICLTLGMRARALAEPENFQHTLRMAQAAGIPVDESFAPMPLFHRHSFQGQTLMHEHVDGDQPHGYYGHPEDFPKQPIGVGGYARQSITFDNAMPKIDPATMSVFVFDNAIPPTKFPTGCPNCGERLYSVEDVETLYPVTIDEDGHSYDNADSVTGDDSGGFRDELCCRSCMWTGDRDDVMAMRAAASEGEPASKCMLCNGDLSDYTDGSTTCANCDPTVTS